MQTTTISKLKASLSAYLRQIKSGEEVVITEYSRPVARLLPPSLVSLPEHLQDMEKAGLMKYGKHLLPDDFWNLRCPSDSQGSCVSGKKTGDILGYVGNRTALRTRANLCDDL